ncbi:SpoVR family protein [Inmirania thermothiophila]|uniref:Stage V sporulation protein R n=1 Tax=Inmirania thermothiophila TaxID=1750597 RepID=A0A3N1XY28_9GAMM|nr:SpoVR family protein [Inmirania thermothiophila]ROR29837.1 stage V sporulation protein R [Inmirania thermothiophila]
MAGAVSIDELRRWDERIRALAERFGLDCYPQEFELCDHFQMLSYMAYSGAPAHYPHWSYGKAYEKLKTLYDHGVSGLPYEMVINANPSIAYLMRDNSLALHILTIAHVYGHNDFFKNNFTFRHTRPELAVAMFKLHAERVRDYIEDPSIGQDAVEEVLDAAHALALQCRRNLAVQRRAGEAERPAPRDPWAAIHPPRQAAPAPPPRRIPAEPEEDLLLFLRDHNPYLAEWQRDLLTIVHEETRYFLPQMETKIMNEGWASFWHREILNALELPPDLHMEFLVRHNQVVRPIPGQINPYHLGLRIWDDIRRRHDEPTPEEIERYGPPDRSGMEKIFEVREVDRDVSFLRRFLTPELMRELDLFEHRRRGKERVVTRTAHGEGWREVKEELLRNVGLGTVPVIRVVDADWEGRRTLLLEHEHDGRDLHLEYAEKTLAHVHRLWGREVVLRTEVNGRPTLLVWGEDGFETREEKRPRR